MLQNQMTAETQSCRLFRFLILKLNHPEVTSFLERTGDHWRSDNLTEFLSPAEIPRSLFILEDLRLQSNIHFLSWVWVCVPNVRNSWPWVWVCDWRDWWLHRFTAYKTHRLILLDVWIHRVCTYLYLCCDSMCCPQWRKLTFKEAVHSATSCCWISCSKCHFTGDYIVGCCWKLTSVLLYVIFWISSRTKYLI